MNKNKKIYVAGHCGMVGSAVWRGLESKGYSNLIGKSSRELDLRNQKEVNDFYKLEKPEVVVDAAAKVGGILANKDYPYQFLMENMQIQKNLIDGAFKNETENWKRSTLNRLKLLPSNGSRLFGRRPYKSKSRTWLEARL